jgi:hypothetical protein
MAPTSSTAASLPCNQNATIKILDNATEDDVSVLTTKTQEELVALLVKARRQIHASTGSWAASGSSIPSGSGPAATPPPSNAGCQQTAPTNNAISGVSGVAVNGEVSNKLSGKYLLVDPPLYPQGGGPQTSLVDSVVSRLRPSKDGISNVAQLIELQYWSIM